MYAREVNSLSVVCQFNCITNMLKLAPSYVNVCIVDCEDAVTFWFAWHFNNIDMEEHYVGNGDADVEVAVTSYIESILVLVAREERRVVVSL